MERPKKARISLFGVTLRQHPARRTSRWGHFPFGHAYQPFGRF